MRLVSVLHDLLVCKTATREKRDELQTYALMVSFFGHMIFVGRN
jgi:hypothetical protein